MIVPALRQVAEAGYLAMIVDRVRDAHVTAERANVE
jgi:hypothetical protein